jgi:carbohydrate-binding DOMON domain-containing protein
MLTEIPISNNMYDLKKQIDQIESELNEFIDLPVQIPELVTSTNLLRLNDFLMKSDHKKTDLISVYSKYSKSMESLLSSVFEIQNELKDILKKQSSLIPSPSKTKTKTKTKIKTKTKTKTKK